MASTGRKTKQQGTLFSFIKAKPTAEISSDNSCSVRGPSVPVQKRTAATAKLKEEVQPDVKKSAVSIKHKMCYKWKDEFPWLTFREDQALLCSLCCNAPDVAGKSHFLTGCASTKKETMQLHAKSNGHLHAHAAVLAKQKPVCGETVIAQSFTKGRQDQDERDWRER